MTSRPLDADAILSDVDLGAGCLNFDLGLDVASFPNGGRISGKQIVRAGDSLRGDVVWSEDRREELLNIFSIANTWRDSHAYPMYRMRYQLVGRMRSAGLSGITAARLKRMPSIRKKLQKTTLKLNQIQDLGGCRAVLPSIDSANRLIDQVKAHFKHQLHHTDDHIVRPKIGGYRSHHLIYMYQSASTADEIYGGRRIEIQIRTRLQHCWATAVEAIGLVRGEDMKAGEGDADWLRLFDLMSSELALAEKCPESPTVPKHRERVEEIRALEKKVFALSTLENLRNAIRYTDLYSNYREGKPVGYRIEYDHRKQEVRVYPSSKMTEAIQDWENIEFKDTTGSGNDVNAVFVSADKIEDLKQAYPNYFGDVQLFTHNLSAVVKGQPAKEYTMPPQQVLPPPPHEAPDLSWFKRPRRWR